MMEEFFPSLYVADERDREIFGDVYKPPKKFQWGKWYRVATFRKEKGSDGADAFVFECRMPAQFYKVRVADSTNSVGKEKKGFALSTGSGEEMAKLALQIAKAASQGMIGLAEPDEDD